MLEGAGGGSGALLDHSIGGSVHRVCRGRRNDLGLGVRTPEGGGNWSFSIVSIKGTVIFPAVGPAGRGGRTKVKNRLKVAATGAGRVWASMVGSGVVEGTAGADGVFGLSTRSYVANAPAISALSTAVGGVGPLD